jgi:hypothetical protein
VSKIPEFSGHDLKKFDAFFKTISGSPSTTSPLGDPKHEIHPLFAQENFVVSNKREQLSDMVYTAMKQALHLATLLILEPLVLRPWDRVANGAMSISSLRTS